MDLDARRITKRSSGTWHAWHFWLAVYLVVRVCAVTFVVRACAP
ncbi:DUF3265 domain-containing protein [Vibrio cholerae]|nr:DUF3265 domain-containing protein [Vibrio cholerae]